MVFPLPNTTANRYSDYPGAGTFFFFGAEAPLSSNNIYILYTWPTLSKWLNVIMTYLICEALGRAREPGGRYQHFTCGVGKWAKLP